MFHNAHVTGSELYLHGAVSNLIPETEECQRPQRPWISQEIPACIGSVFSARTSRRLITGNTVASHHPNPPLLYFYLTHLSSRLIPPSPHHPSRCYPKSLKNWHGGDFFGFLSIVRFMDYSSGHDEATLIRKCISSIPHPSVHVSQTSPPLVTPSALVGP